MTAQITSNCLFTKELLLSVGFGDDDETTRMVGVLNAYVHLWGHEVKMYMGRIIDKVKSETDELSRALRESSPNPDNRSKDKNRTKSPGTDEISRKLKDSEMEVAKLKEEVKALQQSKKNQEKKEAALMGLLKSYNAKCIESDAVRDEAAKQCIWSNEVMRILRTSKAELELSIRELKGENSELRGKLSTEVFLWCV
jgi:chromosome segregation ATPase